MSRSVRSPASEYHAKAAPRMPSVLVPGPRRDVTSVPDSVRSSTVSAASYSLSTTANPLNDVSPPAAYIAASAATRLVTNDHQAFFQSLQEDGIFGPEPPIMCVSDASLKLVNEFLDFLLYTFIATAKSTNLRALRPAVTEVLRPRLAKEAVGGADHELRSYLGGHEGSEMALDEAEDRMNGADWDVEGAWRKARMRCMVYSSLGDLEEEDEAFYSEQPAEGTVSSAQHRSDVVSPAVAIWLTSILEFIGEQTLLVAGHATIARYSVQRIAAAAQDSSIGNGETKSTFPDQPMVECHDTEKVALNPSLGRMWRQWRKKSQAHRGSFSVPTRDSSCHSFTDRITLASNSPSETITPKAESETSSQKASNNDPQAILDAPQTKMEPESGVTESSAAEEPTTSSTTSTPRISVTAASLFASPQAEEPAVRESRPEPSSKRRPTSLIFLPRTHVSPFTLVSVPETIKRHRSLPDLKRGDFADPFAEPEELSNPDEVSDIPTGFSQRRGTGVRSVSQGWPNKRVMGGVSAGPSSRIGGEPRGSKSMKAQERPSSSPNPISQQPDARAEETPVEAERRESLEAEEQVESREQQCVAEDAAAVAPVTDVTSDPATTTSITTTPASESEDDDSDADPVAGGRQERNNLITSAVSGPDNDQPAPPQQPTPPTRRKDSLPLPPDVRSDSIPRIRPSNNDWEYSTGRIHVPYGNTCLSPTYDLDEQQPRPFHIKTASSSSRHSQFSERKIGQLTLVQTSGSTHSERGGMRVFTPPATPDRTRRSSSFSKLQRPTHTSGSISSQASTKLKNLIPWPNDSGKQKQLTESDSDSRSSLHSERLATMDDKERSFEELISGGGTIHCTITPDPIRNMEIRKTSRTETSELAEFLRNTGPEVREVREVRSISTSSGLKAAGNLFRTTTNNTLPKTGAHSNSYDLEPPIQAYRRSSAVTVRAPSRMSESSTRSRAVSNSTRSTEIAPYGSGQRKGSVMSNGMESLPTIVRQHTADSEALPPRMKNRLQARDATGHAGSDTTSALADFFRNTNPPSSGEAAGVRRISRSVAPFRNTMDSTEFEGVGEELGRFSQDHMSSPKAPDAVYNPHTSYQSSFNSSTGLLQSTRANRDNGAHSSLSTSRSMPEVNRKQVRNKDPYAIDVDSDEDDLDSLNLVLPKKREEESFLEFLNSEPPPPPQPTLPFETNAKAVNKKQSAVSLKSRFGRRKNSVSTVDKASVHQPPATPRVHVPLRVEHELEHRPSDSDLSKRPSHTGSIRSSDLEDDYPYQGSASLTVRRPSQPRGGRMEGGGTESLAEFLKNTAPPEPTRVHSSHSEKEGGSKSIFSKIGFSRNKKSAGVA